MLDKEIEERFDEKCDNSILDKPIYIDRWMIAEKDKISIKQFIAKELAIRDEEWENKLKKRDN